MVRRCTIAMSHAALLAFAVAALSSCTLTQTMWQAALAPPDPVVEAAVVPGDVVEVLGASPGTGPLWLRFVVDAGAKGSPAYLAAAPQRTVWLAVQAPVGRSDGRGWRALPGSAGFLLEDWGLRLHHGQYFQRSMPRARIWFRGSLAPELEPRLLSPLDVPSALRDRAPLDAGSATSAQAGACLAAASRHHWLQLVGATRLPMGTHRAQPVAWLDAKGRRTDSPDLTSADCSLLARIPSARGERWVRIPAALLLQGDDLALHRGEGGVLHWRREEVWQAAFGSPPSVADPTLVAQALPRGPVAYRYDREVVPLDLVSLPGAVLATPLTVAVDVLALGMPPLKYWIERWLGLRPGVLTPEGPRRR